MPKPQAKHRVVCSFTDKQWTGRPDDGAGALFGRLSVAGLVLCFLLMTLFPGLRDPAAALLFVALFAATFTTVGILVLHVAGALKHQFFDRDDVLARMLPLVRPRR